MHPDPLSDLLDTLDAPVAFFIRSDDGGWGDDALLALLDLTMPRGVPVDVAMIPEATTPALATALARRQAQAPRLLGLHQHGRAHVNHQPEGRRGEFGDARSLDALRADLHAGRRRLQALLLEAGAPAPDLIFTPPWNRCSPALPALLAEGGWRALSREHRATPQQALPELPVHVDWSRLVREARAAGQPIAHAVSAAMADALRATLPETRTPATPVMHPSPVGLMLHHAAMDDDERRVLGELLDRWAFHPRSAWRRMAHWLDAFTPRPGPLPPGSARPAHRILRSLIVTCSLTCVGLAGTGTAVAQGALTPTPADRTATTGVTGPSGPTAADRAVPNGQRADRARPAAPITGTWLGAQAEWRFSYELTAAERRNYDLDRRDARDRRVRDQEATAEVALRWSAAWDAALELAWLSERRTRPGQRQVREGLQRGPMWLRRSGGWGGLQVGRVPLADARSWWWDDDLDGVRWIWERGAVGLDTGLAREFARRHSADAGIDPAQRGVGRWWGQAHWQWEPRHRLDLFWLATRDGSGAPAAGTSVPDAAQDERDGRLRWAGLRASGQWRPGEHRVGYWADLAWMRGQETLTAFDDTLVTGSTTRRVRGQAADLGLQWTAPGATRPTLSAAWARGSADFRQTGLQENKQRWGGVKRFRRYGELLDAELANLQVSSLGVGLRPTPRSSVELLWHRFAQVRADTSLVDTRLSADPDGVHRALGDEFDLMFAWREWSHAELTLALSHFRPGRAFAVRDPAHGLELGLAVAF